jgi:transcriptional regulator with XRE-family HTH domain
MPKRPSPLKIARVLAGYTQAELAEVAGLDPNYVWELEVGRKRPGRLARMLLSGALEMDADELFPEPTRVGSAA